jgi:cellulose biosynthesis protein BcsQ
MKQKIIVFSNQKGGVGKTTLTRELGIYFSKREFPPCLSTLTRKGT